ncbi:helix-turn-helix domain-containing protein [Nocardia sp. 852002-20019_SCH5090214]|uniref:helix-turn-helix domain-containing protein n=1 Tax=Nocardia sp. 852002-20019_SCH5090214 TaxID=1834087 RepID=UPI0009EE8B00|nr:helix-turn-helix transcriptional regulator [Nocardia sp. 852002-20019_SCH5090214]
MNTRSDPIRTGQTIRALREAYGWTQIGFAEALGLSGSHMTNIEAGRRACTPRTALRIANLLGVPLAAITTDFTPAEITRVHAA